MTPKSPAESVAALDHRFRAMERGADPVAWAVAAYRLGLATAEQPAANPETNLRSALALYEQSSDVLTRDRAPVEHARILNAAGSAHRMLGDGTKAIQLFREATALIQGKGIGAEEAAVLNNLGLTLTEAGRLDAGIEAFERSIQTLPNETEEHLRTSVATQHNLAQAYMAQGGRGGGVEDYNRSISVLEHAVQTCSQIDAPLHEAMVLHSLGVAWKAKAELEPNIAESHSTEAISYFERSLTTFTSVGFPLQHAIAKHNLGHALAIRNDVASLRRALAYYEDSLNIFDPRLHQAQWQEAFKNAEAVEARLELELPGSTRADHTASLVGSMDEVERLAFLRQRLAQLERLPPKNRLERLTEFAYAVVTQPAESFVLTLRTIISVLMELPEPMLQDTLRAQLAAHAMLDPHDQRASDFILDEAINLLLFGPQRIRVRDILEEIGWDRP